MHEGMAQAAVGVDGQIGRGQDAIADRSSASPVFGEGDDAVRIADPCGEGRRRAVLRDVRDDVRAIEDAGEGRQKAGAGDQSDRGRILDGRTPQPPVGHQPTISSGLKK
jgi:hypothetical protein